MENGLKRKPHNCCVSLRSTQAESWEGSMGIEYDRAVEVLAERYGLVMLCEENGLPFAREARDEGRFGVWVVARATGKDYGEVLTDVKRKWKADHQ